MQKIGNEALLAVKFSTGWVHFRVNRHRNWQSLVRYFQNKQDLRFAILWKYNRQTRLWSNKMGYFDKQKSEWYG